MAKQTIDLGSSPNDGTGTTLRAGGLMINENFDELYASFMLVSEGVTMLDSDGGQLTGVLSPGSITSNAISSGSGYPSGSGHLVTFNGGSLDRCFSIYFVLASSAFHLQGYDATGLGLGWGLITTT